MKALTMKVFRNWFADNEKDLGFVVFDGKEFDYSVPRNELKAVRVTLEEDWSGFTEEEEPPGHFTYKRAIYPRKTIGHIIAITNRRLEDGLFFAVPFLEVLSFFNQK